MPANDPDDDLSQIGKIGEVQEIATTHDDPVIRAIAASAIERTLDNAKAKEDQGP